MCTRTKLLHLFVCILLFSAAVLPQQAGKREGGGEIVIVVNKGVPPDTLSLYEVRHIFMGERQYWKSNLPVVLIVPSAGSREREVMLRDIYRMNESQYRQYWVGRIFRAEAPSAPKTADTSAVANELVATVPGCITIMNLNDVHPGSKILKVDGKSPGDRGYPLR
jgi:hypothetical protein